MLCIRKPENSLATFSTTFRNMTIDIEKNFNLNENTLCKRTNATLRIIGPNIDPKEITSVLGVEPSRAFSRGEEYQTKRSGIRKRPIGHWSVSTEKIVQSTSIELHTLKLLEIFEHARTALKELQGSEDRRISVVLWWEGHEGHGGFTISSDTFQRLSAVCEDIDFHFIGSESL